MLGRTARDRGTANRSIIERSFSNPTFNLTPSWRWCFNIGVRTLRRILVTPTPAFLGALVGTLVFLAACGREATYQYLEVPDGETFAKVPTGWDVASGWSSFVFIPDDQLDTAFVPGDNPIAWRAVVNDGSTSLPSGVVSIQSVSVKERDGLVIGPFLAPQPGVEETSRVKVVIGDLEGWRTVQEGEVEGERLIEEEMILTDPTRATIYYVRLLCNADCHDRHRAQIDEVFTTFRVES
jgi:hypothetical protein